MHRFLSDLRRDLDELDQRSLRRSLRALPQTGPVVHVEGRPLVNLAGNDYLGLATHPRLKAAAIDAVERFGTGAGSSRLVAGHLDLHAQAERRFAAFKHADAALMFPTGYLANLAVVATLTRPGDLVCLDKLCHASLIDAARAASANGARVRVFPHLGYDKLERLLERWRMADGCPPSPRAFILTDSIFSMDGDAADLPRLCDLADRYEAILIVDEAHATGVLGKTGAGLCEYQDVTGRVPIVVSTASKALGGLGGIVTGPREVIDTLVNHARPLIYTTAIPPAQAATLIAALDVVRDEPWRRARLLDLSQRLRGALLDRGWRLPNSSIENHKSKIKKSSSSPTPILPLIVGTAGAALALADRLREAGFLAVAIRPPTVARDAARVRLTLRADLDPAHLDGLLAALGSF